MISIIIPTYNCGEWIERCLASVQKQVYQDWECLVINDGSTDNTQEILEKWAQKDNRFRVFRQENAGASSARNLGLDNTKGQWITFVDADDSIEDRFLQDFVDNMDGEEEILIQGFKFLFDKENKIIKPPKGLFELKKMEYENSIFRTEVCCKLYSNKIIQSINLRFDSKVKLGEDAIFFFTYLEHISIIKAIDVAHYNYIYRADSASYKSYGYEQYRYVLSVYNKLIKIIKKVNLEFKKVYTDYIIIIIEKIIYRKSYNKKEKLDILRKIYDDINFSMLCYDKKGWRIRVILLLYRLKLYELVWKLWWKDKNKI